MFVLSNEHTMYLRVNKVAQDMKDINGGNSYTYVKVKNMLRGFKGNTSKKEIQQLRKLLKSYFNQIDSNLAKLEEQ